MDCTCGALVQQATDLYDGVGDGVKEFIVHPNGCQNQRLVGAREACGLSEGSWEGIEEG